MKALMNFSVTFTMFSVALLVAGCQGSKGTGEGLDKRTFYYAIEMNGILCGYAEITQESIDEGGTILYLQTSHTEMQMSIMERSVSTLIDMNCTVDSATGHVRWQAVDIRQGDIRIEGKTTFTDSQAIQESPDSDEPRVIDMPEGYVTDNFLTYPYLFKDFVLNKKKEETYSFLNPLRGTVIQKHYTLEGIDTIFLAGAYHPAMLLEETIPSMSSHSKVWISLEDGLILRNEPRDGNRIKYLADHRIKDLVTTVDLDNVLFYKVGMVISNFKRMYYTRIEAKVNTQGDAVTPETLNFPGQKFTGKVEKGNIEGVFEIQTSRYDGTGAPSFPADPEVYAGVSEYLEPSEFIESDDEDIRKKAEQITDGASDSWEAVRMLSAWVDKNISGAIPGGGTARGTLEKREAECGGHSRLMVAFCRSLGIPARIAQGCMYLPDHGGFFGQHAWSEVWMGESGWIAIDPTIGEIDYVDAGHVRLGERASFHPEYMNIKEYKVEL